ncbi:Uncharacterised protein [Staphylococcus cohnii subsp. cohnii]|nr:Uncharacterised protein [Staphylococcus cohnii subsp. cohnii]
MKFVIESSKLYSKYMKVLSESNALASKFKRGFDHIVMA